MHRGKDQHVYPHNNGWAVKGAGNVKVAKVVETLGEATRIAYERAVKQRSRVKVFGTNEVVNTGKQEFFVRN